MVKQLQPPEITQNPPKKHGGARIGAGRKPRPEREFSLLVWVRRRVAAKLSAMAKAKGVSRSALIAEALTELVR